MAFTVTSNSFKDGDYLPMDFILSADFGFGCAGGNTSPHLKWSRAPAGTKSFAVTCYDPDAPTGSGFWQWLVVNIPHDVSELAAGAGSAGGKMPAGALQTRTDFGKPSYGGPCPPEATTRTAICSRAWPIVSGALVPWMRASVWSTMTSSISIVACRWGPRSSCSISSERHRLNKPMISAFASVAKCRLKPTTAAEVSAATGSLSVFTANTETVVPI